MEKLRKLLVIVIVILLTQGLTTLSSQGQGRNYYVSKAGNDRWSGTLPDHIRAKEGPFQSIEKAMSKMQAGDTCFIREGTYRETIRPLYSGEPGNKLVILNYKSEKVKISACKLVENRWKSVEENIYKTRYDSSEFRSMVFIGGELATQARWPNASGDLFTPVYATVDTGDFESFVDQELPDNFSLEGCEMEALLGKEWALQYYTINGYDTETKTLSYPAPEQRSNYYAPISTWDDNYAARRDNRYYLLGHYDLLDVDGEWHFDSKENTLFLYSKDGVESSGLDIEIKAREYNIDLSGLAYVEVAGLELFGGGILTDELSANCLFRSLKGLHVDPGVIINGSDNELNSCEFAYCSGSIMALDGEDHRIVNNYLHDGNYSGSWDQILSVYGFRHLISHNTISRAGGGCILPSGKEIIYQYNDLSFAGLVRHDIGAMHCGNNSGENSIIAYNRVHDINGMGIYLDNSTSNYVIHHNLIYHCGWQYAMPNAPLDHLINNFVAIRLNTPGNFNLVYNNTSSGKMSFGSWGRNFIKDMYGDQLINNIFTGTFHMNDSSAATYNIYQGTEPLYQDPENLDFSLSPFSPAIDNAINLENISENFKGNAPDMGAFEYGEPVWKAGHDFDNVPTPEFTELRVEYRNLVNNGGFEVGLDGWKSMSEKEPDLITENSWGMETALTRMQNQSIAISDTEAGLEQVFLDLTPETMYTVSAWIKAPGKDVGGKLILSGEEGVISSQNVNSDNWEFIRSSFKTSGGEPNVKIRLEKEGEGPGAVYFDDIGLIKNFDLSVVPDKSFHKQLTDDGAWCWFSDPRAIYVHGQNPGILTGWVKQDGSIEVGLIEKEGSIRTQVIAEKLEVDDHANPSFAELPDGDHLVMYTKHFDDRVRAHYSDRESDSLFGSPVFIDPFSETELEKFPLRRTTYANPLVLNEEDGNVYCFGRWTGFKPNMMISHDQGRTFSKSRVIITNYPFDSENRPYVKYYSDGGSRIHITFTDGHPRNEALNSVYYAYYEKGAFWRIDGSQICTIEELPFEPKDASLVYQANTKKGKSWVFDMASDEEGFPVILYATYPDDHNHFYHHVSYDGKEWIDQEICNSGPWFPETPEGETEREPNYSGGMTLDPLNTNVLYASVQVNGVFEIVRYILDEEGDLLRNPITESSTLDNVRPFVPRNKRAGDPTIVLWMQNESYIHYTQYKSAIKYAVDKDSAYNQD